jgi:hypothetical protein
VRRIATAIAENITASGKFAMFSVTKHRSAITVARSCDIPACDGSVSMICGA